MLPFLRYKLECVATSTKVPLCRATAPAGEATLSSSRCTHATMRRVATAGKQMSMTSGNSQALTRLRAAIATAVAVAFFRRFIKQHLSPALVEMISPALSLSRRWSPKRLQEQLQAAVIQASPTAETPSSLSETPRSLSETWSPSSLKRFFASFQASSAPPSEAAPDAVHVAPPFCTYCEFMEDSLHHPAWGYYCDGRVAFGESFEESDFTTFPVSMRPTFGAMLADRLHELWRLTHSSDSPARTFLIVELGAGTGVLAHDVLSHIAETAPDFYSVVQYVIGERSHALRALQEGTNARFVAGKRLRVVPADARDLQGSMLRETLVEIATTIDGHCPTLRGAVISNELPDAFGVERVLIGQRPPRRASFSSGPPAVATGSSRTERPPSAGITPSASVALRLPSPILRRPDGVKDVGSRVGAPGAHLPSVSTQDRALRLQRGVVVPLIRASELRRCARALRTLCGAHVRAKTLNACSSQLRANPSPPTVCLWFCLCFYCASSIMQASDAPVPSVLSAATLIAQSRAARDTLATGLRDGVWELGCGGVQLLHAADEILREWLQEPPKPPPLSLRSPSLRLSPSIFPWSWNASSEGAGNAHDSAGGSRGGGGEWVHLSREAYCALKGRCCGDAGSVDDDHAISRAEKSSDASRTAADFGTALEAAFDAAVVICEAFEEIARPPPPRDTDTEASQGSSTQDGVSSRQTADASVVALHKWFELHEPLLQSTLRSRAPGERLELFPSPALPDLAAGLASLFDEGAVITVDYGADAATLINSARRVSPAANTSTLPTINTKRSSAGLRVRSRLPCEPGEGAMLALSRPGWSDLTTDVNFTELAAVGESHGLRTVLFGPQTALQRCHQDPDDDQDPSPPLVTNAVPAQRRGVLDAFYSLGSFVMLVQATPAIASAWSWHQASQPLYGPGHPSLGAMAVMHMLRTLGRLVLGHALTLPGELPTERDLVAKLADALLPAVPCFKPHWRAMASAVLRLLAVRVRGEGTADDVLASSPALYRPALALVTADLECVSAVRVH